MTAPIRKLEMPRSTRRYRFSLVPLADTMFQLLVFFMLSANMASYSLLTIRNGALAGSGPAAVPQPDGGDGQVRVSNPMTTAVWSVGADSIVANGQRFALERIPDLARALQLQDTPEVLLVSQRGATVQMLVSILEILADSGISAVRVADGAPA
ncbi:biopolymer transporter ExbD [Paracoccus sp. DMF-8]|uniref:ExbD/TolR family protein n=1 Tax=Paracoccus sp. DMF-8 TaxID=3019445 RepID=UPI0023E7CAC4|nr:biopolymer transporter ExbD [Paracoccus sp. DMF-8]MDF3605047.1 biopolymer transporter ExbD [Paracoccus sp. DMF-8]